MASFSTRLPAGIPAGVRRDVAGGTAFLAAAGVAAVSGDVRSAMAALGAAVVAGSWAAAGMWRAHRSGVSAAQPGLEVAR